MTMTPRLRKFALAAHVAFSVGWLGVVVAYLALAIAGLITHDVSMVRAAYLSMELIGWFVIVPLSFAALLTGLVQSLGTQWGLFRHYWILVKFLLTVAATIVLLRHMPAVSRMAAMAAETTLFSADFRALQIQLVVHAAGGLLVLLAATILSVYKPWGMTAYGRRKQDERRNVPQADLLAHSESSVRHDQGSTANVSRWVYVVGIHAIGLVLLFVVLHLTGGGLRSH
jgi:hypothetical protein